MGDTSERYYVQKTRGNCPFSLFLLLAKDIELKNFTMFIPTEHSLERDLWSKFCETLEERGCFGHTNSRSSENFSWWNQ